MQHFNEANLPIALSERLEQIGFDKPTPIQAQAIPLAMEGKDILGSAATGTGKTGAFGIPLIAHLLNSQDGRALILLPTRELAMQVGKALQDFTKRDSNIRQALLIGGDDMGKQLRQLKSNPRIIVGTPGRINDHLKRKTLKLDKTNFLVLDEVDRMLDIGFGIQLDEIAKYLTDKRQTLMFSATMPKNINNIAAKYLKDPVRISVGQAHLPTENVEQSNIKVTDDEKFPKLLEELGDREGSVIIFVKTKRSADNIARKIKDAGHKSDALHGDLRQNRRSRVIDSFHKQKYRILVATDVAARGLDIPHIEHVINYDLPQCPEDYIHRIGRTARAGAKGHALNLINRADGAKWYAIQRLIDPDTKHEKVEVERKKRRGFKGGRNFAKPAGKSGSRFGKSNSKPGNKPQNQWKARRNKKTNVA